MNTSRPSVRRELRREIAHAAAIRLHPYGLTKPEAASLIEIRNGVDVWSIGLARVLRLMQRRGLPVNDYKSDPRLHPRADALFDITQPKHYRGDGRDQMPYFGAIATPYGIRAARAVIAKHRLARQARRREAPPGAA